MDDLLVFQQRVLDGEIELPPLTMGEKEVVTLVMLEDRVK